MQKKIIPINYTSRDFESIRQELENFARRYYPNTYQDFNEASFGSLMLDTVAYVGDILSFYLDYQTNESFLDSAVEYSNVLRLARQLGYKQTTSPASYGLLTFYIEVPAATTGLGPDPALTPILEAGSTFNSVGGGTYTLLGDVDFNNSAVETVVGQVNPLNGQPTTYVLRLKGRAVSGRGSVATIPMGDFQRFQVVKIPAPNISDVIRVLDTDGNEYYEVDNLSQNIVYKAIRNTGENRRTVPNILKAVPVARRFALETINGETYLQFGYGSANNKLTNPVVDPTEVILDLNGRTYSTEIDFDPTRLISTDKFGIAPANTTLTVEYRYNTTTDVNAGVDTITQIGDARLRFKSQGSLSTASRATVRNSLEVSNEQSFVGDVSLPSTEEVRQRTYSHFATQNRAVTGRDYQALCYSMPPKYGMIKRAAVLKDTDEFKRNVNILVISESSTGKLIKSNATLKNNLKNWLLHYKMISDTIDILDPLIVNYAVEYEVMTDLGANRFEVINRCTDALASQLSFVQDIGERLSLTEMYRILQKVEGVVDVSSLEVKLRSGNLYSESNYNFEGALSADGKNVLAASNVIFELKYPNLDLIGSVR
jgi:hypothetical protein